MTRVEGKGEARAEADSFGMTRVEGKDEARAEADSCGMTRVEGEGEGKGESRFLRNDKGEKGSLWAEKTSSEVPVMPTPIAWV
jgi:hypothetical protein